MDQPLGLKAAAKELFQLLTSGHKEEKFGSNTNVLVDLLQHVRQGSHNKGEAPIGFATIVRVVGKKLGGN